VIEQIPASDKLSGICIRREGDVCWMKIYTKTGDEGLTSVIGGRVPKDDSRVETYGTIDELNSYVGVAISLMNNQAQFQDLEELLLNIQHELFDCGSDLAFVRKQDRSYKVTPEFIRKLEEAIDRMESETPPLKRFILPGGSMLSSQLHICRTVCRRAERLVVTMARNTEINAEVRSYLNRLSDFFFVAARLANVRSGIPDIEYVRSAEVFRTEDK
jgi:cob(I)alamin adenosyltransferase